MPREAFRFPQCRFTSGQYFYIILPPTLTVRVFQRFGERYTLLFIIYFKISTGFCISLILLFSAYFDVVFNILYIYLRSKISPPRTSRHLRWLVYLPPSDRSSIVPLLKESHTNPPLDTTEYVAEHRAMLQPCINQYACPMQLEPLCSAILWYRCTTPEG